MSLHRKNRGFTLIELLIVIAIIGILAGVIIGQVNRARDKARFARMQLDFKNFAAALQMYLDDHDDYPPDVYRGIPSGVEQYLAGGRWPKGPYPHSVYDWDNVGGAHPYVQLSLRFCDFSGTHCYFPKEDWAQNFDDKSSVYYCFEGECKAHPSYPASHPGYCINCQ